MDNAIKEYKLAEHYGGYWKGEHPDHTVADWKQDVRDDNTRYGYWAWVNSNIESDGDE
jgi:hypothetical protein